MRLPSDTHQKMMSAYQLLQEGTISVSTFEYLRTLLKGIHPKLDEKLETCSKAMNTLQKIQNMDIITLSVEGLSEETEKKKKRKKALLFFIESLKNLKSEIKRIDAEFTQAQVNGNSLQANTAAWGRIIGFGKGPFGVVTIIALVAVGFLFIMSHRSSKTTNIAPAVNHATAKTQIIMYNGKQIPLSQLYVGHGTDCNGPHYHATKGIVTTLDGTVIPDPEGCGYGKVADVQIIEVMLSPTP